MDQKRRMLIQASVATALTGLHTLAGAKSEWRATRPIQLIVPGQAGGMSDIVARVFGAGAGNDLGERIIVDNRPGASGVIGSYLLSNAPPDGQTLLTASSDTHTIYPHFFNNSKFVPEKHVPIATLAFVPFALAVNRNLPVTNLREFVELCKKKTISYSTWGIGTTGHAAMLAFMRSAGIPDMLHVPFTGSAPAVQALLAGQVDAMMGAIPLISTNRAQLRPLAVMSRELSAALPGTPTLAQAGMGKAADSKGFWVGLMAPPGTPAAIVDVIAAETAKVMRQPEVRKKLQGMGAQSESLGPTGFSRLITEESARWSAITRDAGVVRQNI
ncbi:tripartite tricarboxylate transporter substrate binding protein [Cupriavidus sp. GA3-3]|uniref:Bug family tripartite tricarboxylate transporter substrate binding protein n=1 Tax=Cupriavidus TaxID=106589 RepID=UPI00055F9E7F|nr:tripartite tricarboxylate transporter substrate binding protein [Cupriavidus sp. GA3-3]